MRPSLNGPFLIHHRLRAFKSKLGQIAVGRPKEKEVQAEGANHDVAWFDEKLENAKLGLCRGSGVLIKVDGQWKVKQYNLTMLVPNEIAEKIASMSREEPKPPGR